jgi:DNA-binding transcriptional regulator YiaG
MAVLLCHRGAPNLRHSSYGTARGTRCTVLDMRTKLSAIQILELREWLSTGRAAEIRSAAGLPRSALARDLGVAESALWRWERGERTPTGLYAAAYYQLLSRIAARSPAAVPGTGGADAA